VWANWPPCINENKWHTDLTHVSMFLGFKINMHLMTLLWPLNKCICFHQHITAILEAYSSHGFARCRAITQALGLLQNGCTVLPLDSMMSLQLQHAFNIKVSIAMGGTSSASHQHCFWDAANLWLTLHLAADLKDIQALLDIKNPTSRVWTQPIGLLIPHKIHFTFFSDASYDNMGGWCPQLDLMWHITKSELALLRFHMVPTLSQPLMTQHQGPYTSTSWNSLL